MPSFFWVSIIIDFSHCPQSLEPPSPSKGQWLLSCYTLRSIVIYHFTNTSSCLIHHCSTNVLSFWLIFDYKLTFCVYKQNYYLVNGNKKRNVKVFRKSYTSGGLKYHTNNMFRASKKGFILTWPRKSVLWLF